MPNLEMVQLADRIVAIQNTGKDFKVIWHPSVCWMQSRWPILDIWRARKVPRDEIDIHLEGRAQQVLISKRESRVRCELIDPVQYELMCELKNDQRFQQAIITLANRDVAIEPTVMQEWFTTWVSQGLITDLAL